MKSHDIKNFAVLQLVKIVAVLVRHAPGNKIKQFLLNKVYEPYFGWRKLDIDACTFFGATMHLNLPDAIQTKILLTGYWEPVVTRVIGNSLSKGDVFIDIGANVGYYTLFSSYLVGDAGRVYAFEASPQIYKRLQMNMATSRINNAHIFNIAVSNRPGSIWVWSAPPGNIGHSTIMNDIAIEDGHTREAEVPCNSLAELVPMADLISARMIKMDIEGAERLAIEGVFPFLKNFSNRTEWIVELSPKFSEESVVDTEWIFNVFIDAGYKGYRINNNYDTMVYDASDPNVELMERMEIPPKDGLHDVLFSKLHIA